MDKVKVLIVGAGPAGSTCALLLKKQNIDCLLVDRAEFPRDKICGGGLTPRSNRLTAEGLYYAILTASHAAEAIISGRPFAEVNSKVFAHKKKEMWESRFFYSKTGLALLRLLCNNFPGILKWCFNRATTPRT